MAKKKLTLGMAAAAAAGTAVYVAKKSQDKKNQNGTSQNNIRDKANSGWSLTQHKINSGWTFNKKDDRNSAVNNSYRNTERGKYEKNSKGIYYTNGNYEAFARPEKPEGVEEKHAYIVGSGLASLAAACFLVRDGQMPGEHIHILEAMDIAGGACDGIFDPSRGYIMRGGREMENHFECLWDLFHSIPSLEIPGASVLDEFYWLNKHDPNYSLCRATVNRGKDAHTDGKFNLSQKGCMEIMKLFMTKDEDLYDKTIEDVFRLLQGCSFLGSFLAYQYTIDMNYSPYINFSENDFVKAGIGAIRGIKKCFLCYGNKCEDAIWYVKEHFNDLQKRYGYTSFHPLLGHEPTLIDLQNCFCETDKYLRAKMPELRIGNVRIKQKYMPHTDPIQFFFPPKWNIVEMYKYKPIVVPTLFDL